MITQTEVLNFLKVNRLLFRTTFHCEKIGLFGSFARNEQTERSDIDILVEFEPGTPNLYENELALKEFISSHFNLKVDICTEKWIKPLFKPLVLKDVIYA
ncbi:MAG: nucleotidyltransferase family protein [Paludibacter sp.]